jgi:hypothetical protein
MLIDKLHPGPTLAIFIAQVKAQMAELAAAETRRSITREKKNQQELQMRFDNELTTQVSAAERRCVPYPRCH